MNLLIPFLIFSLLFCNTKRNESQIPSDPDKKEPEILLLKLNSFKGDISITRGNEKIPLTPDLEIENEDLIKVGADGSAEFLLGLDDIIKVGNHSELWVTNLMTIEGETSTNITINSGTILATIVTEKKERLITLITPNVIANVNNSTLLTQVFERENQNLSCDKKNCLTKLVALDGSVHVKQAGSKTDIVLDKKFQIIVSKENEIAPNMILPLDAKSLASIDRMQSSLDAKTFEGNSFESITAIKTLKVNKKQDQKKNTLIKKPKSKNHNLKNSIMNKDFHSDKLKLDSNQRF